MTATVNLRVYGTPAPQGSKRHVGNGVMVESSAKVKPWREAVKHAALEVLPDHSMFATAVFIDVSFMLARPKGHYRTGKMSHLLRDTAPVRPASKPDLDKLVRSTLDALSDAGVWRDDSQVVSVLAHKYYVAHGIPPGAVIRVGVPVGAAANGAPA